MDEKKAFDDMLAEIAADDSSEEDNSKVRRGNSFKRPQSGNKSQLTTGNNVRESMGKDYNRKGIKHFQSLFSQYFYTSITYR